MPLGAAIIGGAAVLGAGAMTYAGSKNAAETQAKTSGQAIDFAKQQEAERVKEWNIQQAAAKRAWETQQANLAPYRAARASVLAKYGINTNVELPPPDFSAGPPPGWKPGDPMPTAGGPTPATAQKTGSGVDPMLLGASGIAGLAGLQQLLARRSPDPTLGGPGLDAWGGKLPQDAWGGTLPPRVDPSQLSNYKDWSSQYGVPGQSYQGE